MNPFKPFFEVSLERVNHLRQIACTGFHFPRQQGATVTDRLAVTCLRRVGRGRQAHRLAGQDATVEGAFHIPGAPTCKRDRLMIILNVYGSFLPIHCYNIICVTQIQ